ncbi:hypothetical protein M7I_2940 [Glarea lozoyensis 74030]|uniref:Uncharacterized protein n=1 Tax=Glarea lozoyensis (strain ATCC 74030 / MF5533) TaxID=1104152 RepID=H0EK49_GLAL7|nr:hypothetical protein M7I_2940 [Glarea lozoyensis 74030]
MSVSHASNTATTAVTVSIRPVVVICAFHVFDLDAGVVAHVGAGRGGRGVRWEGVVGGVGEGGVVGVRVRGREKTFAAGVGTGGCLEVF